MSQQLISRSPDFRRLRDEGYALEIRSGYLLVTQVPYVTAAKEVEYGVLVAPLTLSGDRTTTPQDHVVRFSGDAPCDRDGRRLDQLINSSQNEDLGSGLVVNHLFSQKPATPYRDFYEKMTTYIAIISSPAFSLNPDVTATPFPVAEHVAHDSPFVYEDTASSRAGITAMTERFHGHRVAIVGLGGTGSYVLDLVAKTPVAEIHIFDGDHFFQHNAFRAPGAASVEDLQAKPFKVDYFRDQYSKLHGHVVPHEYFIHADNVAELTDMHFVFLTMDDSGAKREIVAHLEDSHVPFIDVGMGLHVENGAVAGIVRVTTSTPGQRDHVHSKNRIPFARAAIEDEYAQNIQVADLNALNATLAVIRWKKHIGFYRDLDGEHFSTYTVDGNHLLNEDHAR